MVGTIPAWAVIIVKVHFYLADQDWSTTSSLGIYHYSRCLLAALAKGECDGLELVVSVNRENGSRLLPDVLPDWIQVVEVPLLRGIGRLWTDHVLCPLLGRRLKVEAIFCPKGWVPLYTPRSMKIMATVHDTILDHYGEKYPAVLPKAKRFYFRWMLRHSLRVCDVLFTVSEFSKRELARRWGPLPSCSLVMPEGTTFAAGKHENPPRSGLMVMGSTLPHKCTEESLRLLEVYRSWSGFSEPVYLTGSLPQGLTVPEGVHVLGRIPFEALHERLGRVRALVFLSEIEGFGLPLLEAYSLGTPVVYRDAHAFREIMNGRPGAWDGASEESFCLALEDVLGLNADRIDEIRIQLLDRYNWDRAAAVFRSAVKRLEGSS